MHTSTPQSSLLVLLLATSCLVVALAAASANHPFAEETVVVSAADRDPLISPKFATLRARFTALQEGRDRLQHPGTPTDRQSLVHMWDYLPSFKGFIPTATSSSSSSSVQWDTPHFSFIADPLTISGTTLSFNIHLKRKSFGMDEFLFMTLRGMHLHSFILDGDKSITFTGLEEDELESIRLVGLRCFALKGPIDEAEGLIETMWSLLTLFNPKLYHVPWTITENIEFLHTYVNLTLTPRATKEPFQYTITESDLRPGDVFASFLLDGLAPMILWTSGGRSGHMAIVWSDMDHDNATVICDTTTPGVQCRSFKDWMDAQKAEHYMIDWLPLADEYREKLDLQKGWDWFKSVDHLAYGQHNLLFSMIDTKYQNLPAPMNHDHFIEFVGAFVHHFTKSDTCDVVAPALALRVGLPPDTTHWPTVLLETERRFGNDPLLATTLPEQDSWLYKGKPSLVCSTFVTKWLKEAGIFGDLDFQATEFTPHDLCDLAIYQHHPTLPQACWDNDPDLASKGYCQVMGLYKLDLLDSYNTIPPHPHMFESCPSQSPRSPTC